MIKVRKSDEVTGLDLESWKYIVVIERKQISKKKNDYYDSVGIKEGYFNSRNELVGYTYGFETLSYPEDEGVSVVKETLKMMLKDITKDTRVLDERVGKKCLETFNKQSVKGLANKVATLKLKIPKRNKRK
jgi:hypothetical protein